jgi:hypothetical protein
LAVGQRARTLRQTSVILSYMAVRRRASCIRTVILDTEVHHQILRKLLGKATRIIDLAGCSIRRAITHRQHRTSTRRQDKELEATVTSDLAGMTDNTATRAGRGTTDSTASRGQVTIDSTAKPRDRIPALTKTKVTCHHSTRARRRMIQVNKQAIGHILRRMEVSKVGSQRTDPGKTCKLAGLGSSQHICP